VLPPSGAVLSFEAVARRNRLAVAAAILAPACGISVTGTPHDAGPATADAGSAIATEGGAVQPGTDGGRDLDSSDCVDAAFSLSVSFDTAAQLEPFVIATDKTPGPVIESDAGIRFFRSTDPGSRAALWFATPVPLDAFDVSFEILVTCARDCGDGLAFVWLDTGSADGGFAGLTNGGSSFGIPRNFGGGAVAVDLLQGPGSALNDPPAPALEILGLDSGRSPGTFPWVVGGATAPDLDAPAWTKIAIKVRRGHVVVAAAGREVEADVPPLARGVFGITAATGSSHFTFNVRNLGASFGCAQAR
jgi:hypothetical protein